MRLRCTWPSFERVWNSSTLAYVLIVLALCMCVHYIRWTPPPGYAVAVLAFIAAVMSIRKNSGMQKFLWLPSMAILLGIEFHSIRIDRQLNDSQQQTRFELQMNQFKAIGTGITTSMNANQTYFEQTMRNAKVLLDTTNDVALMAKGSLEEITGANSFPYISPQVHGYDGGIIPLAVWDVGKNMLANVAITIRNSEDYGGDAIKFAAAPEIEIGVVHPGWPRMLKGGISPHPHGTDGSDVYVIEMYTQHELYIETLHFRKLASGSGWAFRSVVSHEEFSHKGQGSKRVNMGRSVPLCGSSRWSDEPAPKYKHSNPKELKPCWEYN